LWNYFNKVTRRWFFSLLKVFRPNNQIFSRLLISYALVLLLPIVISWLAYWQTIRAVEQDSRASNIDMLRHSSQLVERYLTEINSTTLRIAMNAGGGVG
jgi:hypothetical protein